jgi:hypothetical protein
MAFDFFVCINDLQRSEAEFTDMDRTDGVFSATLSTFEAYCISHIVTFSIIDSFDLSFSRFIKNSLTKEGESNFFPC